MSNDALTHAFAVQGLDPAVKLVLVAIADRTNDKRGGLAWPSIPELMRMSSVSRTWVKHSIRKLVEEGHIEVAEPARGTRSARYRILARGSLSGPQAEPLGGHSVALGGHSVTARGSLSDPKPLEPLEPSAQNARANVADATSMIKYWAEITGGGLTPKVQTKWYGLAVAFVASVPSDFPAREFLRYAAAAGCNSPAGWPHYVAEFTQQRKLSGVSPETAAAAAETIRRIRAGEDRAEDNR